MSNLARKLQDANCVVLNNVGYTVTGYDLDEMVEGSQDNCLFTEEQDYGEEYYFTYDDLVEADQDGELSVYTLVPWDDIKRTPKELEASCLQNYPESEIITYTEALERWSVLSKYEERCMQDCLKLRCLGQTGDAQDIITRATREEYCMAKRANVCTQFMNAMSVFGPALVFYELGESKGARYGLANHEYYSFSF